MKKLAISMLMVAGLLGCSSGEDEEVVTDSSDTEEVSTETTTTTTEIEDSPDNMDIMTEEELLAITGHEWNSFDDEEKFDAVSNLMFHLSENEGYAFSLTEMDYVNFLDDSYSKSEHLDKQFASLFIFIYAIEEE
jgi:hypothetical protein